MTFSRLTIKCRYPNENHPTVFLFPSHPFLSLWLLVAFFLSALKWILAIHYRFYTKLRTQDL